MVTKNQALYMANVYKLLANEKCLKIIKALEFANVNGYTMNVTEILVKARLYENETSAMLNKMKRLGMVTSVRSGKFVNYSINKKMFDELGCIENYIVNLEIK
jgi:hypothetical protein